MLRGLCWQMAEQQELRAEVTRTHTELHTDKYNISIYHVGLKDRNPGFTVNDNRCLQLEWSRFP